MSIENVLPALDKDKISSQGTEVEIDHAQVKENVQTSMGKISKALTVECHIAGNKDKYSYLFSIDKDPVVGSIGRILAKTGIKHINELDGKALKKLEGMKIIVKNKGGKLYWN